MAIPIFIDYSPQTPITASWLNSVSTLGWGVFGGATNTIPTTLSQFIQNIGIFSTGQTNVVVSSIAALRAVSSASAQSAMVTGYYAAHDGGGDFFQFNPADTTSADNGVTIIVASDGGRWYRVKSGPLTLRKCGGRLNYTGGAGTDDTAALLAGFAVLATTGGELVIDSDGVAYIAGVAGLVSVPAGVTVKSSFRTPDSTLPMAANPIQILTLGGAIALSSGATFSLAGGSSIDGLLVYRAGIALPAVNSSAFAGTCFTVAGPGVSIRNSLAVGFNQLIESNGYERLKVDWFFGDGQNGIEITNARDVPRVSHVHLWPFATYTPTAPITNHYRTGVGVNIHDTVDAVMLLDVFVYGYATRFSFANVSTVRWIGCMGDGDINQPGSVGLLLTGNINGFLGTANALWSCQTGASVNMNNGQFVDLVDLKFDTIAGAGIDLIGGGVDVSECLFTNMTNALKIENLNVEAYFDHNQYAAISGDVVACAVAGVGNVIIGSNNFNLNNTAGATLNTSNMTLPGLTSAATLNLNPNFHNYFILGTVAISIIAAGWVNRIVRLKFTGVITVNNGTGTNAIRLSGGTNYTSSNGSTLSLMHDGTQWFEIGRTA